MTMTSPVGLDPAFWKAFPVFDDNAVARAVAEQTGAEIVEMHSCQSVTGEEFEAGETYLSLMTRNVEALRKGLY